MPIGDELHRIDPEDIKVSEKRDRKDFKDIEGLGESIKKIGLINPIILDRNHNLIAGERRLLAVKHIRRQYIEFRYIDELTDEEQHLLQIEENLRRADLSWMEECMAIHELHVQLAEKDEWTIERTAKFGNWSPSWVSRRVLVAKEILKGNPRVLACETIGAAYNVIQREMERELDSQMEDANEILLELDRDSEEEKPVKVKPEAERVETGEVGEAAPPSKDTSVTPASQSVICADFREWAPKYAGKPFNFLHCDFPYGVGHHKTDQGGSARYGSYEDTEDVYFDLLDCLCKNFDRLITPNSHIMFWLSMNHYLETVQIFNNLSERRKKSQTAITVYPHPLIWFKSDGIGIVPDAQRGPRRVYETALQIMVGDRKIVKSVNNLIAFPANKQAAKHISEKPYPVVSHFFSMFVDRSTRMLDPTCGSGSALNAATSKWAADVIGLDTDETHVHNSRVRLNRLRFTMAGKAEQAPSVAEEISIDFDPEIEL